MRFIIINCKYNQKMEKAYGLLEKAINLIHSNQLKEFEQNFETNESIPIKMRNILSSIKALPLKLIEGLNKFRDFITINQSQLIYALCLDDSYPQQYRQSLKQIYSFIDECQKRQNMAFEDSLFYKDVIKKISNDQQGLAEDFVAKKNNIAPDKRENAIKLISQVKDLRSRSSIILEKDKDNDRSSQMEDELRAVQRSYLESKNHIQKLETEIRKLKIVNEALKEQQNKSLQNINNLEEQNRKLMDEKKAIQSKVTTLEQKCKEQKSERIRLQQVVKKIESALLQKQKQIDQKLAINDELLIKIEELQKKPQSNSSIDPQLFRKIPQLFDCAEKISLILTSSSNMSSLSAMSHIYFQDSFSIEQETFIDHLKRKFNLNNQSINSLKKELGQFAQASIFVDYPSKKGGNFMKDLTTKRSLLLIGLTKNGSAIGGYLENGIRMGERNSNSFIFACNKQKTLILRLKRGKAGFIKDQQFLIFGEEELVLSPKSSYVSSYYEESAVVGDQFHYEGSIIARESFLEISDAALPRNKIALEKYELIEIIKK